MTRSFHSIAAQVLVTLFLLQYTLLSHGDSPNVWFGSFFGQQEKKLKDVAVNAVELPEQYRINVSGVDFSADGKYLAVVSADENINIWDWKSQRIVRTLEKAQGANGGLTTEPILFSPDGRLFVACHSRAANDIVARVWNTDTWEIVHDIVDRIPGTGCDAMGFTPDGKSFLRLLNRLPEFPQETLVVYDTDSWQPMWRLPLPDLHAQALAISPDGKFIAIGGYVRRATPIQRQVVSVDIKQRKVVRTIQSTIINRLVWSPDGDYISVIGVGLQIFDAHSGDLILEDLQSRGTHKSLRYTLDGRYLIEGDMNGKGTGTGVKIWDRQHQKLLQEIPGNVGSLAVTRDSNYFAMGADKKTVVWRLK